MNQQRGVTVWFTGLSGAGKTTIANAVDRELKIAAASVELLDGDELRQTLCRGLGFSAIDRIENMRRIGFVAHLLTKNGVIVLVSTISPYREIRQELRRKIGDFIEVYVNAPVAVCEWRDVKGLYEQARAGLIENFTGIDAAYEVPLQPDVECQTDRETIAQSTIKVLTKLEKLGYI
ncbi:adenylyl-sulfate kinase [Chamaesiphon sp. VAR_48_metabat_403]|uniref:adenylyl-sulfate kinase n=1 Tax=Chamaesiphon sp. VAR_48_metabat_403 TaxID=2964700 RepID=UPI00286DC9C8|nr:adenylyl-sulfate kinase [Chamaesiphon sp. VAR_48_metabat_403]